MLKSYWEIVCHLLYWQRFDCLIIGLSDKEADRAYLLTFAPPTKTAIVFNFFVQPGQGAQKLTVKHFGTCEAYGLVSNLINLKRLEPKSNQFILSNSPRSSGIDSTIYLKVKLKVAVKPRKLLKRLFLESHRLYRLPNTALRNHAQT